MRRWEAVRVIGHAPPACEEAIHTKHGDRLMRGFLAGRAAGGVMQIDPCPTCKEGALRYRIDGNGDTTANCTSCSVAWRER